MRWESEASSGALRACASAAAKRQRWRSSSSRPGHRIPHMTALTSRIDRAAKEYLQNAAALDAQLSDLSERLAEIRLGGGESARKRHTERGKLLPRARIEALLDRATDFFELSAFAGFGVYEDPLPAAGLITG